jgi:adenylate cyclase
LQLNEEDNEKSVTHFRKAIELDPEYGRAYAALALVYLNAADYGWAVLGIEGRGAYRGNFQRLVEKITKFPSALGHVVIANEHFYSGLADQARFEAARAIALQPSNPEAHIAMAWAMITAGNPAEGLNFVQAAIRLNPRHPSHYVVTEGIAHFGIGDLSKAASVFEEGIERYPKAVELKPLAASIFALLDRRQEARAAVMTWRPGIDQSALRRVADGYIFPIR